MCVGVHVCGCACVWACVCVWACICVGVHMCGRAYVYVFIRVIVDFLGKGERSYELAALLSVRRGVNWC